MFKKVLAMVAMFVMILGASVSFVGTANASGGDVYTTPGLHDSGGREWRTTCGKYSSVIDRCFTEIKSGGEWVHNNISYLPVAHKAWGDNPFANSGLFESNGRDWATICNDSWTGKNACRTFVRNVNNHQWDFNSVTYFTPGSVNFPVGSFNRLKDTFTMSSSIIIEKDVGEK